MAKIIMIDGIIGCGKTSTTEALKKLIEKDFLKCKWIDDYKVMDIYPSGKFKKNGGPGKDSPRMIYTLFSKPKNFDYIIADRSIISHMVLNRRKGIDESWMRYGESINLGEDFFLVYIEIPKRMLSVTFRRKIKDKVNPQKKGLIDYLRSQAPAKDGAVDLKRITNIYFEKQKEYSTLFDEFKGKKLKIKLNEGLTPAKRAKKIYDFVSKN